MKSRCTQSIRQRRFVRTWLRCAAVGGVVALWAITGWSRVVLVHNGLAQAVVVTSKAPSPTTVFAAQELVEHIEQATGTRLAIVDESAVPDDPPGRIYLGDTRAARAAGLTPDTLPDETAWLRATNRVLFVAAREGPGDPLNRRNTEAGILWGVYDLLDRELGVRWLWPGELGTVVPRTADIVIPTQDRRVQPHFKRRNLRTRRARANDPRTGFSSEGLARYLDAESRFLRRHGMGGRFPTARHSFTRWWRQHGETHPEWFQQLPERDKIEHWIEELQLDRRFQVVGTMREDRRGPANPESPAYVSMCVSSPGLLAAILDDWNARRERDAADALVIALGENDIPAFCVCEACRALDGPQMTPQERAALPRYVRLTQMPFDAGTRYARFWESVHDAATVIDPDVRITAFIYMNYFTAPQEPMALHPNITLAFVPWLGWWLPRMPEEERWLNEQWTAWHATGATLYYRPNYLLDGYAMPHLSTRQFARSFQHYARHGNMATDFDSLLGQWSAQGPMLYLVARMHTRPLDDIDALLQEYYDAFGPAAEAVERYFDYWEHHTARFADPDDVLFRHGRGTGYPGRAHVMFPPDTFATAESLLDAALDAAQAGDPVHRKRVAFVGDGLQHARLTVAMTAAMADPDAGEAQRRDALDELVAFRRRIEDRFVSNYLGLCPVEQRWAQRYLED